MFNAFEHKLSNTLPESRTACLLTGALIGVTMINVVSLVDLNLLVGSYLEATLEDICIVVGLVPNPIDRNSKNENKSTEEKLTDTMKRRVPLKAIDRNLHVNNAFYISEMNISRRTLCQKLGIWWYARQRSASMGAKRFNLVVSANAIRYRRELTLWQQYDIKSTLVDWDDESCCFFIETKFIIGSNEDQFVAAIAYTKYKVISADQPPLPTDILQSLKVLPSDYIHIYDRDINRVPQFIESWEQANHISSKELRK